MTRSSTKELFTPFKDPEREFRSSGKLLKTLSLDESRSPEFNLFSDLEEYSEEEVAEIMAQTMEQYMSKTRADYGSEFARPKIDDKDNFELKGQFLKELRDNTFSVPFQGGGYRAAALGFYQRNNANPSYQERRQSMEETLSKFIKAYSYGASHIDNSIPRKEKDPGSFTLPCYINNVFFDNALADLGASNKANGTNLNVNRSLDPLYEDYIELNDLNVPLELRRNQVDDLMPTIEEGEVIDELMIDIIKTRNNESFDEYPIVENMDGYRDQDMGDIILGEPFCKVSCVEARRFDGLITIHNGSDNVTYQIARSTFHEFKHLSNAQCNKIKLLLKSVLAITAYHAHDTADETLYQAWERFKELSMKCTQHYLTEMQEVILFYNGLEVPTRHILDSKGSIPSKTTTDAKVTIQEMVEYSQKWHNGTSRTRSTKTFDGLAAIQEQLNNLGREIKKVNKKVYAAQVGCEQCKGPYYTKDCPLKEEGKTLEEAYYTQFCGPFQGGGYRAAAPGFYQRNNANPSYQERRQSMEETLSKFIRASVSVMPLSTYLNLGLGELAHTKLTAELADKTIKYPKGISENILVGIGKFVFPVDFIILDMPEDVKVPLILGRPFLSTAHAKIDVFKRKITLRVGDEKIIFKRVKPANPLFGDYIELNDLNVPLELRRDQVDDLMPTIEEVENMDGYRDQDMGDIILGELFCKASCVEARRFDGLITIHNGSDNMTYQIARSHPRFKHLSNAQ
ncbi:putative reverse transcriptase domain-containing protein [Tanacetum coccineum]